jgi:hypothetical protein
MVTILETLPHKEVMRVIQFLWMKQASSIKIHHQVTGVYDDRTVITLHVTKWCRVCKCLN